jgi:hypothetical protein
MFPMIAYYPWANNLSRAIKLAAAAASNIIRAANPALQYAGYNDAINGNDHKYDHKNDLTQKLHQKQYKIITNDTKIFGFIQARF